MGLILLSVLTVLALSAVTVLADGGTLDIQGTSNDSFVEDFTDDGAIVQYIGEDSPQGDLGASGSGIYDSFVRVQATGTEDGYNTDGTLEFDTVAGNFTHSILVSEIPTIEEGGNLYFELFADLNENNSPSGRPISLNDFEIWFTDDPNITGYPFDAPTADGEKVYDFAGSILIKDWNAGSGRGDVRYLVPLSGITLPEDCNYGNAACETYFVLYSQWGTTANFASDATFEEWKVKIYPFLTVEKTAETSFTRTFPWTITKSVTPDTWAIFDGDSGTSDYTVALVKGTGVDSDWAVEGTITIENPSSQDAVIESVADAVSGVGAADVDCPETFPFTLPAGDTLVCTYSLDLPNGTNRTNTATATLVDGPAFTGTAPVTFGAPTTLVNDTVHVTDTFAGGPQNEAFSASGSTTYSRTFECGDDEGTHNNTATIVETSQSDNASVTVTCYDLTVTKTAVPAFSRDFDWTIEKLVDPTSLDMFDGDSDDVTWTVNWTKGPAEDSAYAVSGTITVANNHPSLGAVINSLADVINPGAIAGIVDCAPATFPHTIAAGGSLVCTYEATLPDDADRTNRATATQQNYDYASDLTPTAGGTTSYFDEADIDFDGVNPTVTDDTATITDDRGPLNQLESTSGSTSYDETFECGEDEGTHSNTAVVTETDSLDSDTDDATVTVTCYELTVTKDATTTYSRDYDWDIAKTRFIAEGEDDGDGDPLTLTLDEGQTYTASYEITVTMTGFTDADHAVSGTITISNPAPMIAEDVVVSDVISHVADPDILPTLDCGDGPGDDEVDVPAADSATCSYSADLPNADDRLNTATATLFGIGYSGTADVLFDLDNPTTEIDECIDITDDAGTPDTGDDIDLGTVCVGDLDENNQWTDEYTLDIGPFAVCGEYTFTNTVSFVTTDDENDTDESGSATYTVTIDVPCPEGCTLTQGYWKTHNESFHGGAPADDTWLLLGDVDGDGTEEYEGEEFFLSGLTYFEVLWTNPGGNAYFQLAHQYIAAQLNMLDGADGSAIATAFAQATTLFETYTDEEIGALKGNNPLRKQFISLAGTLADYNEGDIGPGHCDESPVELAAVPFLPMGALSLMAALGRRRRSVR